MRWPLWDIDGQGGFDAVNEAQSRAAEQQVVSRDVGGRVHKA